MSAEIINAGLLAISFLVLFALAELLYYKLSVRAEFTRKLVHFGTGLLTLLFPLRLNDQWLVLLLCATFSVIIIASLKFNFLRSINGIDRKSHGSISYPFSVYGCYLVYNYYLHRNGTGINPYMYFYLPILTLAVCDPVAALVGKRFPLGKYRVGKDFKSLAGSFSFFASSLLLTLAVYTWLSPGLISLPAILPLAVLIAGLAALSEALSGRGIDNITIPATVVVLLIVFT
jgi:phytol kinase